MMGKAGPVMWGRLMLAACAGLYCLLAIGSGLDRLSERNPTLERLVPAFFRAQADRAAAAVALAQNDRPAALRHARAAVRSDPFHHQTAGLLGAALLLSGDGIAGEAAFRHSARMGWRDTLTQAYWYEAALRSRDFPGAARRADAIMRQNPSFVRADVLLDPLEQSPAGRRALAGVLAGRPAWLGRYVWPAETMDDTALLRRAEVFHLLGQTGGALGCDLPRPFADFMLGRGLRDPAEKLWLIHCPQEIVENGLGDRQFTALAASDSLSLFGWRAHRSGDVRVEPMAIAPAGGGVAIRNRSATSRLALSQASSLLPGDYLITGQFGDGVAPARGAIALSWDCGASAGLPTVISGDLAHGGQKISVGTCDGQQTGIWVRPGERTIELLALDVRKL